MRPLVVVLLAISFSALALGCSQVLTRKPANQSREIGTDELAPIHQVLKRWHEGYEKKNIEMYMSAFWEKGYLYVSDVGTDDTTDDIVVNDIQKERDAAMRVFKKFQEIKIEISEPPIFIKLNETKEQAEVKIHYRVQIFCPDDKLPEGKFLGYLSEGDSVFTLDLREGEWRIVKWVDQSLSPEELNQTFLLKRKV
jgi:hypothetical protein